MGSLEIAANAVGTSELQSSVDFGTNTVSGRVEILSSVSDRVVTQITGDIAGAGSIATFGANGSVNCGLSSLAGNPNNGYVNVRDAQGTIQAGIYVDASGNGIVFGDTKNFRLAHPYLADQEIWYACIEGPEAAAYVRGTATMVNGKASVTFPEHFQIVAQAQGMTVMLTPLDASSKGLAVTLKTTSGFEVQELLGGNGTYDFDWEVKAVRKGYENYRVVRSKSEAMSTVEAEQAETKQ